MSTGGGGVGWFWPPRHPFRLNGAALRASPGSTSAGAAKTKTGRMGQNINIQGGQMERAKWARPE